MPDPITAIIGGAFGLAGAGISSIGASSAAEPQANATTEATKLQYQMYEEGQLDKL